jgi:hypothetical protein
VSVRRWIAVEVRVGEWEAHSLRRLLLVVQVASSPFFLSFPDDPLHFNVFASSPWVHHLPLLRSPLPILQPRLSLNLGFRVLHRSDLNIGYLLSEDIAAAFKTSANHSPLLQVQSANTTVLE